MPRFIPDERLDAQCAVLEGNTVHLLTGVPTTALELSTMSLVNHSISGVYLKSAAPDGGRQNLFPAQANALILGNGFVNHLGVSNDGTQILEVVPIATQQVAAGGLINIGGWYHIQRGPK